jgi:hypothetical protein
MLERDRLSLRAHRAEVEATEKAERERREAPIKEAVRKLNETHQKLREAMRERLLGRVPDPDPIVDPAVAGVKMTRKQADDFNKSEFKTFCERNPDVFWTEELADNCGVYFAANGLQIISANLIGALIERYRDAGLLPDPPATPEPEPEPTQDHPAPTEAKPEVFDGWCLQSGEPRTYSAREVDRMSADEYRRAFRLYSDNLSLPNLGPGARWTGRDRESRL